MAEWAAESGACAQTEGNCDAQASWDAQADWAADSNQWDAPVSNRTLLTHSGTLQGHGGGVTALAVSRQDSNVLVSASHDRTVIIWDLHRDDSNISGTPRHTLMGHLSAVSDVAVSPDGTLALSGSRDGTLRLWEVDTGACYRELIGHTKEVICVGFSSDSKQIVSGSADKTIKLWNKLGCCKYTIESGHAGRVSAVRFSCTVPAPTVMDGWVVSAGCNQVKVWNSRTCKLLSTVDVHNDKITSMTISPDGSLCVVAGNDSVELWAMYGGKLSEYILSFDACGKINVAVFSPTRYWLCVGTQSSICIWELETKECIAELIVQNDDTSSEVECTSLAWSDDGNTLYAGYTDNGIRIWRVRE